MVLARVCPLVVQVLEQDLREENQNDKDEADWQTYGHLGLISAFFGYFPLMQGVWIDSSLTLELFALGGYIVEVAHEPLIGYLVLLSNPAFIEESNPDHHDYPVDEAKWRVEVLFRFFTVLVPVKHHDTSKDEPDKHGWNQPASVMDQPSEVEG